MGGGKVNTSFMEFSRFPQAYTEACKWLKNGRMRDTKRCRRVSLQEKFDDAFYSEAAAGGFLWIADLRNWRRKANGEAG